MIENQPDIYKLWLHLTLCVEAEDDEHCRHWTVFEATEISKPACNLATPPTLPGDGTVAGFITHVGNMVTAEAKTLLLRSMSLDVSIMIEANQNSDL